MGNVEFFLGTSFNWLHHKEGNISVHIYQEKLTEFTEHNFSVHTTNNVPKMNPYQSDYPINSIPPVHPIEINLPRQKELYQRIVSCINCLATYTRPDISSELTFLTSYSNSPHQQHYKASLHVLKYLTAQIYTKTPFR